MFPCPSLCLAAMGSPYLCTSCHWPCLCATLPCCFLGGNGGGSACEQQNVNALMLTCQASFFHLDKPAPIMLPDVEANSHVSTSLKGLLAHGESVSGSVGHTFVEVCVTVLNRASHVGGRVCIHACIGPEEGSGVGRAHAQAASVSFGNAVGSPPPRI